MHTSEPTEHRLADGRAVTLRPIRETDAPLERAFLAGLSEESRYLRFHKWVAAPSDRLVHFLTDIDHEHHVAFVCTGRTADGREQIAGEGRYVLFEPNQTACEFGIVIDDDWRKTGIAGLLMHRLIETARARGVKEMIGVVLRTNRSMLKFARALGFELIADPADRDTVRVSKRL
jgi:acetyltransferase